jgi:CDP-diacylglycerol---serine O-phosphatidyltransferase
MRRPSKREEGPEAQAPRPDSKPEAASGGGQDGNGGRRMRVVPGGRLAISPLRRGVYILPNLITTASLFAGVYSILASFRGDFVMASVTVMMANVFDALDGRIARVTNSTSEFGIEYDSLADLVAFGVAPAVLVFRWGLEPWGTWGWLAASLYVTCGALRLARFNVQYDNAEKRHFIGLPIPGAAEVIASTVLLHQYLGGQALTERSVMGLVVVYSLAGLMVSNVRYWSFKEIHFHRRQPFWVLMAVIVLLNLFIAEPQIFLFAAFSLFALSGPARWVIIRGRRLFLQRMRQRNKPDLTSDGTVL